MNMILPFLAGVLLGMFVMAVLKATLLDTLNEMRRLKSDNKTLLDHIRVQSAEAEALVDKAQLLVKDARRYNDTAEAYHADGKILRDQANNLLHLAQQIDAKSN